MHIRSLPRYIYEFPAYVRGTKRATTVWGDKMTVPFPEFRSLCQYGYIGGAEKAVYDYLESSISSGDVFFDIGANAGFYSLLGAHNGAKVFAFEPVTDTFNMLKKNVTGRDIELVKAAVSSTVGKIRMSLTPRKPGLNKVDPTGKVVVNTITLDGLSTIPTIMKVDVEGHELEVFKGAEKMLRTHHPRIVAEITNEGAVDFLVSLGYKKSLLGKNNHLFIPLV